MLEISENKINNLIELKNLLKDNLSLLILIPTVLGGILQLIQLLSISPALIRFFSLSQLIIDGLFIVIYFIIAVVIPYFAAYKFMAFTEKISSTKLKIVQIVCMVSIISTMIIHLLCGELFTVNVLYGFLFQIFTFFIYGCGLFIRSPIHINNFSEKTKNKIHRLNYFMIGLVTCFGLFLASSTFIKITHSIPIDNFHSLEKKYKSQGKVEILYFNDKYIFLRIESTIKDDSKIHIEKLESVL